MSAYLELSRPDGDISRWEKVWKRLVLLNKNYPIEAENCTIKDFIRTFDTPIDSLPLIYNTILNSIIKQKLVFFGGYAIYSYSKYISQRDRKRLIRHPDFDVLANDPLQSANIIKNELTNIGRVRSNVGGYQSENLDVLKDPFLNLLKDIT